MAYHTQPMQGDSYATRDLTPDLIGRLHRHDGGTQMPKGFTNGRKKAKADDKPLDLTPRDPFGNSTEIDLALDFGEILPEVIRYVVAGVCHAGGYVSFSAGPGGQSVKFSISIGGSTGFRWASSPQELNGYLAKARDAIQEHHGGYWPGPGVATKPPEFAVKDNPSA